MVTVGLNGRYISVCHGKLQLYPSLRLFADDNGLHWKLMPVGHEAVWP